jgi:hypothetical protein
MGKRSEFKRLVRDAYDTPAEAVAPLLPWLRPDARFIEPCAGAGKFVGGKSPGAARTCATPSASVCACFGSSSLEFQGMAPLCPVARMALTG